MKKLKILVLTLVVSMLISVAFAQKSPIIKGSILNNRFDNVTLKLAYGSTPASYGTAEIKEDGTFELKSTAVENDIYALYFNDKDNFLVVLAPGQTIELVINADDLRSIPSVSGSPSMDFAKQAGDIIGYGRKMLDSINTALQSDKRQQYFYSFAQNFNMLYQSCNDINVEIGKLYASVDSLKAKTDFYAPSGKINPKYVEEYSYYSNNLLRTIVSSYSPIENFAHNSQSLYDFRNNRVGGYDAFYSKLDQYLNVMAQNNAQVTASMGKFIDGANDLIAERDSLVFADAFDKKKVKTEWCAKVVALLNDNYATMSASAKDLQKQTAVTTKEGKEIFNSAQGIVSGIVQQYQTMYNEIGDQNNVNMKNLLLQNKEDIAVLMFLDVFPREKNVALHNEIVKALHEKYPNHLLVNDRYKIETSPANATSVGAIAPELAFSDPDGNIRKLSDLRGNVVLIDFWASWCRPCRGENPHVVAMYKKYHDKGFEVYSVSLDRDKSSWVNAIKADGLVWPNHVSDLKYWQSEGAKLYGVSSIPCTFLIDRDGRILAKGLRGDDLSRALKQLFNE